MLGTWQSGVTCYRIQKIGNDQWKTGQLLRKKSVLLNKKDQLKLLNDLPPSYQWIAKPWINTLNLLLSPLPSLSFKQLATPENTITFHNTLCLATQNFAKALFSVSLGAILTPKRNWRQCLRKILGWLTEHYGMSWYFLEWSIFPSSLFLNDRLY